LRRCHPLTHQLQRISDFRAARRFLRQKQLWRQLGGVQDAEARASSAFKTAQQNHQQQLDSIARQKQALFQVQQSISAHQQVDLFVPDGGALLEAIARNKGKFRQPVLGPIGANIELSDNRCVVIVT
jgi:hypothetical protein